MVILTMTIGQYLVVEAINVKKKKNNNTDCFKN